MIDNSLYKFYTILFCFILVSCGGPTPSMPSQSWSGMRIEVETRPPQLVSGMNEFIVLATKDERVAVSNLIVSLRINDEDRWHQAIQDGHVGAYRKALLVRNPMQDVLFVRIEYDDREGILSFPLKEQKIYSDMQ